MSHLPGGEAVNVLDNARIAVAITEFAATHTLYRTPDGAKDRCQKAAFEFMGYAAAAGCEDCEVIEGMYVDGDGIVIYAHSVLRIGYRVYDWTARQFYPPAAWPVVMTLDDWNQFMVPSDGDGNAG